jgi:hypothetical protein
MFQISDILDQVVDIKKLFQSVVMGKFICTLYEDYVTNVTTRSPFFKDVALQHWVIGGRCFKNAMLS